jgi:acetolactate synthase-1/2/3 large subunit
MTPQTHPNRAASETGAQIVHRVLLSRNVEILFTVPGAAIVELLDVLHDSTIRTILTRHEQGACHMADGYARSTGRTGVILATSGPGATNLVTGLACAHADSIPLVALTGQVKRHLLGTDAFQEADMPRIASSITKHAYRVMHVDDLEQTVNEAFDLASTHRPGPVLVDLPADILAQAAVRASCRERRRQPGQRPGIS